MLTVAFIFCMQHIFNDNIEYQKGGDICARNKINVYKVQTCALYIQEKSCDEISLRTYKDTKGG